MKLHLLLLIGCLFFLSCKKKPDIKPTKETLPTKENVEVISNELELQKDSLDNHLQDSIRDAFYSYDTLLIEQYPSKYGHDIKVEGSQSGSIYRLTVVPKGGKKKQFDITEDKYIASHTSITGENEDYIFLYFGCGTACVGEMILPLRDNTEIMTYTSIFFRDRNQSIIGYLDNEKPNDIIVENYKRNTTKQFTINSCEESLIPFYNIEAELKQTGQLQLLMTDDGCDDEIMMEIDISQLIN